MIHTNPQTRLTIHCSNQDTTLDLLEVLLRGIGVQLTITLTPSTHDIVLSIPDILITDQLPDHEYCDLAIMYTEQPPSIDILHGAQYPLVWVKRNDTETLVELLTQILDTSNHGQIEKYKECCHSRCQCR